MKRMMIGQYGKYDPDKHKRDFRPHFFGVECCLFPGDADVQRMMRQAEADGFGYGVHFPLRAGRAPLRDALFMSPDEETRRRAFRSIEDELVYMAGMRMQPEYILFHYPKPVILEGRVDWSLWKFADRSEYMDADEYAMERFVADSEALFAWLSAKGREYGFIPVLEFDALPPYLYASEQIPALLDEYGAIKLCLDTGRLFFQQAIDPCFDAEAVLNRYAKYAHVVHLWTLQVFGNRIEHYHHPVLPDQCPDQRWAPIERYLNVLVRHNDRFKIVFEHRSDLIDDEQLETCYQWVEQLLEAARRRQQNQ